ncbi:hypothetical protein L484_021442 [Morus notabilis]|uniref:Uncharacterized protein n=1 Tax=Morus notabilis TaxID=981085 RepID=W9S075_9ROSA|nr:hypothetical protein L484_021442 [Morus notabilis]
MAILSAVVGWAGPNLVSIMSLSGIQNIVIREANMYYTLIGERCYVYILLYVSILTGIESCFTEAEEMAEVEAKSIDLSGVNYQLRESFHPTQPIQSVRSIF